MTASKPCLQAAMRFKLAACSLRIANLGDYDSLEDWAGRGTPPDPALKPPAAKFLPMMQARRLKAGSRMAADLGFELLSHAPDFIVFCSRHGELERNLSILTALAEHGDVSPTDFAMSVHNAAAGVLTVTAKAPIPISSVSSGQDTFVQGLCEAVAALQNHRRVLLVDFDGAVPARFMGELKGQTLGYPYAAGLIVERGEELGVSCTEVQKPGISVDPMWPQSLQFLRHHLAGAREFSIPGEFGVWNFAERLS